MPDSFNTSVSIQMQEEDTNSVTRFMNETFSFEPSDYRSGKITLDSDASDKLLAANFNYIFFLAEDNVGYKIGDVGDTEKSGRAFMHRGSTTSVYLTNNSDSTINVEFVCANFA